MNSIKLLGSVAGLAAGIMACTLYPAISQAQEPLTSQIEQQVSVTINKSRMLMLPRAASKVAVANPDIADIILTRNNQVLVLGKAIGATNVMIWDHRGDLIRSFNVDIDYDFRAIKEKMHELLPNENIEVSRAESALVLKGDVASAAAADTAQRVAEKFAKLAMVSKEDKKKEPADFVMNLLTLGNAQQVMLKVKVAEVQRTLVKRWDMRFKTLRNGHWSLGGVNGTASFPDALFGTDALESSVFNQGVNNGMWGPSIPEIQTGDFAIPDKGLFGSLLTDSFYFMFALDAAKNTGMAKILAEPNLTTLTGKEASFISGGEFPIPVQGDDNSITVDYKEFGVQVKFTPRVLSDQQINMDINVLVSEISSTNTLQVNVDSAAARFLIPGLTKRASASTVELADGQTIAIAGLINENMRDIVNKLPFLGDLPVLGTLFRSRDFQKGETELVILVTPQLVKSVNMKDIQLPTDHYVEPNDFEFYLMGKSVERKLPRKSLVVDTTPGVALEGATNGTFGHTLEPRAGYQSIEPVTANASSSSTNNASPNSVSKKVQE